MFQTLFKRFYVTKVITQIELCFYYVTVIHYCMSIQHDILYMSYVINSHHKRSISRSTNENNKDINITTRKWEINYMSTLEECTNNKAKILRLSLRSIKTKQKYVGCKLTL